MWNEEGVREGGGGVGSGVNFVLYAWWGSRGVERASTTAPSGLVGHAPTSPTIATLEHALPPFTALNPLHCVQSMKNSVTRGRDKAGLEARRPARKSWPSTPVGCGTVAERDELLESC
jgi:hypothetical protein